MPVDAAAGILFPPSLIVSVAAGGLAGGVIGLPWGGMSRKDVMGLGDLVDTDSAALLVIGKDTLEKELTEAEKDAG